MRGVRRALTQLQGQCIYSGCLQALPTCSGEALQGSELRLVHAASRVAAGPSASCRPHESVRLPCNQQYRTLFGGFGKPAAKKFSQRRLVGWSPDQMYTVVSDVNEYHKFVPWCQKSVVINKSADGKSMQAELEVGFQLLVERYISQVTLKAPRMVQSTVRDSMLFDHLDSTWSMEPGPSPGTCWLSFNVDFAFNSVLYGHLADMFFDQVVTRMSGAFETRCQQLYGPSTLLRLRRPNSNRQ